MINPTGAVEPEHGTIRMHLTGRPSYAGIVWHDGHPHALLRWGPLELDLDDLLAARDLASAGEVLAAQLGVAYDNRITGTSGGPA